MYADLELGCSISSYDLCTRSREEPRTSFGSAGWKRTLNICELRAGARWLSFVTFPRKPDAQPTLSADNFRTILEIGDAIIFSRSR